MQKVLKTISYIIMLNMIAAKMSHSTGFSLYMESNGQAVGNFGAGLAAEAADASIGWYNPAGLILICNQELVVGGVGVFPVSKLSGSSTFSSATSFEPPFPSVINYVEEFNNLKSSKNALIPSLHYALPLNENTSFGLSIVSPFGLATDWGNDSSVRYEATLTDLNTMNISPEIARRMSKHFSVGAGLDLQYAQVKFNRILGAPPILNFFDQDPLRTDSLSINQGSSYGMGFHAGILATFNENNTRLGINYQSKMNHQFHGRSTLSGYLASADYLADPPTTGVFTSSDLYSDPIRFPDILTLSAYQQVSERLALLASVVYTGWSVFDVIKLNNVAAVSIDFSTRITKILMDAPSPQHFKNVWRAALGANYCINSQWLLRVGGGYDQTPTNDIDRDMRLPDTDRLGLSVGAHYQFRPNLGVDLGYTHLFGLGNSHVNRIDPLGAFSSYTVNATGKNYAHLFGAQLVWMI